MDLHILQFADSIEDPPRCSPLHAVIPTAVFLLSFCRVSVVEHLFGDVIRYRLAGVF